jgi:hypothetical protein
VADRADLAVDRLVQYRDPRTVRSRGIVSLARVVDDLSRYRPRRQEAAEKRAIALQALLAGLVIVDSGSRDALERVRQPCASVPIANHANVAIVELE